MKPSFFSTFGSVNRNFNANSGSLSFLSYTISIHMLVFIIKSVSVILMFFIFQIQGVISNRLSPKQIVILEIGSFIFLGSMSNVSGNFSDFNISDLIFVQANFQVSR